MFSFSWIYKEMQCDWESSSVPFTAESVSRADTKIACKSFLKKISFFIRNQGKEKFSVFLYFIYLFTYYEQKQQGPKSGKHLLQNNSFSRLGPRISCTKEEQLDLCCTAKDLTASCPSSYVHSTRMWHMAENNILGGKNTTQRTISQNINLITGLRSVFEQKWPYTIGT